MCAWIKKRRIAAFFDVAPYCRILESIACDSIVKISMGIGMKCVRNSIYIPIYSYFCCFFPSCLRSPFSYLLSPSLLIFHSQSWHICIYICVCLCVYVLHRIVLVLCKICIYVCTVSRSTRAMCACLTIV